MTMPQGSLSIPSSAFRRIAETMFKRQVVGETREQLAGDGIHKRTAYNLVEEDSMVSTCSLKPPIVDSIIGTQ